ncbi:MAG: hypothetical protein A4E64_02898 [Syntrophorhabdus sp. PtaU1.Bin058]|nr:MAG: hypothetical protein A4E64_02898 [Syntrophorhabdus sp. PtaU1.Bin058]
MNKQFYTVFGYLTSAFACMEGDLRFLVAGIAFGNDSITTSAFMDSSQLIDNLRILRKLSRQYWGAESQFAEVIDSIEQIRSTRNLFIHGLWTPGKFGETNGVASVQDLKTSFESSSTMREWRHGQTMDFSLDDFRILLADVNEAIDKIAKLREWLEKHEGIEFGYIGFTSKLKPVSIRIDSGDKFEKSLPAEIEEET